MVDKKCPYVELLFDDAVVGGGGSYKCKAENRGREWGEYGEGCDFFNCDSDNSEKCNFFLKQQGLDGGVRNG
jgi:hypothetical protein